MSAYYYDEALLKKLNKWSKDTALTITGVNDTKRMFTVIADKTDDKPIQLPLVTLSRNGGFKILNKQKQPITFNGHRLTQSIDKTMQLNAIPIEIEYQIDIYTRYFQECDEYARSFVFNIINYPKLEVEIPYQNADLIHYGNIRLFSEIEDNSDIPERLIAGQFYRMTITINVDDAYLFDIKVKQNYHINSISFGETGNKEAQSEEPNDKFYQEN